MSAINWFSIGISALAIAISVHSVHMSRRTSRRIRNRQLHHRMDTWTTDE
jgi:hypothetical protein